MTSTCLLALDCRCLIPVILLQEKQNQIHADIIFTVILIMVMNGDPRLLFCDLDALNYGKYKHLEKI